MVVVMVVVVVVCVCVCVVRHSNNTSLVYAIY